MMDMVFKKTMFGYDKGQVDAYVRTMGLEHEEMSRAHDELSVRCSELERKQVEAARVIDRYCQENKALSCIITQQEHERAEASAELSAPRKKRTRLSVVADVIFYVAIALILVAALTFGAKTGAPRTFMGYSTLSVLTSSMQSEIPRGSLVLVKQVDPGSINVGDTITYMRDANTSITHKVVDVFENYQNSGGRGFETQGVNNANPDPDIVAASNVVGVVIFHVPGAGAVMMFLGENLYLVFIIFALLVVLSLSLRGLFGKQKIGSKGRPAVRERALDSVRP